MDGFTSETDTENNEESEWEEVSQTDHQPLRREPRMSATTVRSRYGLRQSELDRIPYALTTNPRFRSAAPMRLYERNDVEAFIRERDRPESHEEIAERQAREDKERLDRMYAKEMQKREGREKAIRCLSNARQKCEAGWKLREKIEKTPPQIPEDKNITTTIEHMPTNILDKIAGYMVDSSSLCGIYGYDFAAQDFANISLVAKSPMLQYMSLSGHRQLHNKIKDDFYNVDHNEREIQIMNMRRKQVKNKEIYAKTDNEVNIITHHLNGTVIPRSLPKKQISQCNKTIVEDVYHNRMTGSSYPIAAMHYFKAEPSMANIPFYDYYCGYEGSFYKKFKAQEMLEKYPDVYRAILTGEGDVIFNPVKTGVNGKKKPKTLSQKATTTVLKEFSVKNITLKSKEEQQTCLIEHTVFDSFKIANGVDFMYACSPLFQNDENGLSLLYIYTIKRIRALMNTKGCEYRMISCLCDIVNYVKRAEGQPTESYFTPKIAESSVNFRRSLYEMCGDSFATLIKKAEMYHEKEKSYYTNSENMPGPSFKNNVGSNSDEAIKQTREIDSILEKYATVPKLVHLPTENAIIRAHASPEHEARLRDMVNDYRKLKAYFTDCDINLFSRAENNDQSRDKKRRITCAIPFCTHRINIPLSGSRRRHGLGICYSCLAQARIVAQMDGTYNPSDILLHVVRNDDFKYLKKVYMIKHYEIVRRYQWI